jgi:hypothetical protein
VKGVRSDKQVTLQLYFRDWLSDLRLQSCTAATRGIWIQILCFMANDGFSGILRDITLAELQRIGNCTWAELQQFLWDAKLHQFCDLQLSCMCDMALAACAADVNACPQKKEKCPSIVQLVNRRMWRELSQRKKWAFQKRQQRAKEQMSTACPPVSNQRPSPNSYSSTNRESKLSLSGHDGPGKPSSKHPHVLKIAELFNQILVPPLDQVQITSKGQLESDLIAAQINQRWQRRAKYRDYDFWQQLFIRIRDQMSFLLGENGRQWQASLSWITRKQNFEKIMEGVYLDRKRKPGPGRSPPLSEDLAKQAAYLDAIRRRQDEQQQGEERCRIDGPDNFEHGQ